jgi:glyoxylase-like metal-dependent hydrolase (beta-lactamase superfamily II)
MMPHYICVQCGVQFAATDTPPDHCPICEDERQYVNWQGQQWTTLDELRSGHTNLIRPEAPHLFGIGTEPSFAIGQRALLVQTLGGNVLWDCITLLDEATIKSVEWMGGISAIAISHPHYYSASVEWSDAFGNVPIYIHAADRKWVMRPDPAIIFWEGESRKIGNGLTLIRCGIHFDGGQVLHWAEGAEGSGALLVGDIFQVASDRRYVSFMYSYPNYIPERVPVIRRALRAVEPYPFEQIYGAWWNRVVARDAKAALARSAERYFKQVQSE